MLAVRSRVLRAVLDTSALFFIIIKKPVVLMRDRTTGFFDGAYFVIIDL